MAFSFSCFNVNTNKALLSDAEPTHPTNRKISLCRDPERCALLASIVSASHGVEGHQNSTASSVRGTTSPCNPPERTTDESAGCRCTDEVPKNQTQQLTDRQAGRLRPGLFMRQMDRDRQQQNFARSAQVMSRHSVRAHLVDGRGGRTMSSTLMARASLLALAHARSCMSNTESNGAQNQARRIALSSVPPPGQQHSIYLERSILRGGKY